MLTIPNWSTVPSEKKIADGGFGIDITFLQTKFVGRSIFFAMAFQQISSIFRSVSKNRLKIWIDLSNNHWTIAKRNIYSHVRMFAVFKAPEFMQISFNRFSFF